MFSTATSYKWHKVYSMYIAILCFVLLQGAMVYSQTLLAKYPLLTNLTDSTGHFGPVQLLGNSPTSPPSSGNPLCQNGIYSPATGGQDIRTPNISTLTATNLTFSIDFKLSGYPTSSFFPVIMIGQSYRWLGIYVNSAGYVGVKYNNSNYLFSCELLQLNQWYNGQIQYANNTVSLTLDGVTILSSSIGPLTDGTNYIFTTNDFGNGKALYGCVRNLAIYNGTATLPPLITTNPSNQNGCLGSPVTFSATVTGATTKQWQESTDNGTNWTSLPNDTSSTLTFTPTSNQYGNLYRIVCTNSAGTAISCSATLSSLSFRITTSAQHGTVTKTPNQGSYSCGTTVTLTPVPAKGFYFKNWAGDTSGTTNPLAFSIQKNMSITAVFDTLPAYTAKYRTASYWTWATSSDLKGKRASLKRKTDKDFFDFLLVADSSRILNLDLGVTVNGYISLLSLPEDTLVDLDGMKKIKDTLLTVNKGDTIEVSGVGEKGKKLKVKYSWGAKGKTLTLPDSAFIDNTPGFPMPNLVNVGEEMFKKGYGQTNPVYNAGLLLGVSQGAKKANSMLLGKYADVLTTLAKLKKKAYIFDTTGIRCLDSLGKKPIAKQLKALGPDKYQSQILAEALTLKLNIGASSAGKFPVGLGGLVYNNASDPTNPFNHCSVSQISSYGDSMLSCLTLASKPTATLQELFNAMNKINYAFVDSPYTIDTLSFAAKTQLTGIKKLYDVSYLEAAPDPIPASDMKVTESAGTTPEKFTLYQNYPNPFNPTTTISYSLRNNAIVTLKVYDILGREVVTLLENEMLESGIHETQFNANSLASGVYFYRLTAQSMNQNGLQESFTDVKRMLLIK